MGEAGEVAGLHDLNEAPYLVLARRPGQQPRHDTLRQARLLARQAALDRLSHTPRIGRRRLIAESISALRADRRARKCLSEASGVNGTGEEALELAELTDGCDRERRSEAPQPVQPLERAGLKRRLVH